MDLAFECFQGVGQLRELFGLSGWRAVEEFADLLRGPSSGGRDSAN